jgi:hypothetical protein
MESDLPNKLKFVQLLSRLKDKKDASRKKTLEKIRKTASNR